MVNHQTDLEEIDFPENSPGDYGEIFDYIVQEGPVTYQKLCGNTPFMSRDEISTALEWLRENDYATNDEEVAIRGTWYIPVEE